MQWSTFVPLSLFIVNIFVGNLAWGVDDVALQEAFEAHGEVERAKVIHDRETGRSRGFGFVEMPNQEEAEAALEAMEGKELMGREIRCNESEARERRLLKLLLCIEREATRPPFLFGTLSTLI